jgi:rare lipoprotein A
MKSSVNYVAPLTALLLLHGCVLGGANGSEHIPALSANSPAADFPRVLGDPFTIDSVTYTPADTLNYDAVGYAVISDMAESKIAGAHKTLPLPSYVEVTNLDSGKTILVRIETRGPMSNDDLIELSSGAASQLGLSPGETTAVRVRRVNPPESERALLRGGSRAPSRMETPEPLLKVLKRKLVERKPLVAPAAPTAPTPVATLEQSTTTIVQQKPEPAPQAAASKPAPLKNGLVVQVAAFSSQARADTAAASLGATVSKPGKYWNMRLGPFATQQEAQAALEKARSAGYSDARIQRAN